MDFLARKKVALKMSYTVVDSLPFPRALPTGSWAARILELAARLTCTASEMVPIWNELAREGLVRRCPEDRVPGFVHPDQRFDARAELDALVAAHVFGLTRDELEYVLETFPIVRRRDEEEHGEFRTRKQILRHFDAMTGRPSTAVRADK